jgi:hypothetical protein
VSFGGYQGGWGGGGEGIVKKEGEREGVLKYQIT